MLDIRRIREHPEKARENFRRRGMDAPVDEILALDQEKLRLQTVLQEKQRQKNQLSKAVAQQKKQGLTADDLLENIQSLKDEVHTLERAFRSKEAHLQGILKRLPNLLDEDVPETDEVLSQYKDKPAFSFSPRSHLELCKRHGLVDYETAGQLMGSGFWIYRGLGARLEWALLNFCLEENQKAGYEMVMLPPVAGEDCGFGAGQFPRFRDEVYRIQDQNLFLIPTAETILANFHRDRILREDELPLRYTAYTPCFRREVSKEPEERGMIRGHHFNKVELAQFAAEGRSEEAFGQVLAQAERLMQKLKLHYRVVKLAAKGCSAAMARTYDIEVWLPAEQRYKEVSSISNARDYQSRRTNTRYTSRDKKLRYAHTVNGSGIATSRVFAAILEQNQTEDGSVRLPEALAPWMGTCVIL